MTQKNDWLKQLLLDGSEAASYVAPVAGAIGGGILGAAGGPAGIIAGAGAGLGLGNAVGQGIKAIGDGVEADDARKAEDLLLQQQEDQALEQEKELKLLARKQAAMQILQNFF